METSEIYSKQLNKEAVLINFSTTATGFGGADHLSVSEDESLGRSAKMLLRTASMC